MPNICPKCKSTNIFVHKKGFSGKQAVAGALAAGPIGAAAGTINSNKIKITCLDCGYSYYAGDYNKELSKLNPPEQEFSALVLALYMFFFSLFTCIIWAIFDSLFFGMISIVAACVFAVSLIISIVNNQPESSKKKEQRQKDRIIKEYENLFGTPTKAETITDMDSFIRDHRAENHNSRQQQEVVVGIEIKRSDNPDCDCELCKIAAGRYPKKFKWTGWHDGCTCCATSIYKTPDEIALENDRVKRGEPLSTVSINSVTQIPFKLKMYIKQHPELKTTEWYLNNKAMFN